MAKTMVQKILESHLVSGRLIPGEEIGIRIDQTLTQDLPGPWLPPVRGDEGRESRPTLGVIRQTQHAARRL